MVENAEQMRRQRHELRRQLTVIQGLSREDNTPLKQYIEQLFQAIPITPKVYCENPAVNAIVSHYAALCEEQQISADIRLNSSLEYGILTITIDNSFDGPVFRSSVYVKL